MTSLTSGLFSRRDCLKVCGGVQVFKLYDAFVISSSNWSAVICILTLDRTGGSLLFSVEVYWDFFSVSCCVRWPNGFFWTYTAYTLLIGKCVGCSSPPVERESKLLWERKKNLSSWVLWLLIIGFIFYIFLYLKYVPSIFFCLKTS